MRLRVVALTVVVLLAGSCGGADDEPDVGNAATSVDVLAAASLTDAFTAVADAFEVANPSVEITLAFGSSSSLREQVLAGAPADVFASANTSTMQQLVDAGAAAEPQVFVRNRLAIAVPAGNPAGITGLADFGRGDLLLGLCAEEVPCGQFARQALAGAGVAPAIDTNAPDVRALLGQVESGDLDAGIVYRTDVESAGDAVEGIDIPDDQNVVAEYPIAVLTASGRAAAARAFVDFVLSDEGQAILRSFGFLTR